MDLQDKVRLTQLRRIAAANRTFQRRYTFQSLAMYVLSLRRGGRVSQVRVAGVKIEAVLARNN